MRKMFAALLAAVPMAVSAAPAAANHSAAIIMPMVEREGACDPNAVVSWTAPPNIQQIHWRSFAGPRDNPGAGQSLWGVLIGPSDVYRISSTTSIVLEPEVELWFYVRVRTGGGSTPGHWSDWMMVDQLRPQGPGDGFNCAVENDAPSDAIAVIRDFGTENAPLIRAVLGAVFLVGLTFWLIRRGLAKARSGMRL